MRSDPSLSTARSTSDRARCRLVFQMLRPSTTPSDNTRFGRALAITSESCSGGSNQIHMEARNRQF